MVGGIEVAFTETTGGTNRTITTLLSMLRYEN